MASPAFLPADPAFAAGVAPFRSVVNLAADEIRRKTTADQRRWLVNHPRTWLVALTELQRDIQNQISAKLTALEPLRPSPNDQPSEEYLTRKRETTEQLKPARAFLSRAGARITEVRAMFDLEKPLAPSQADLAADLAVLLALLAIDDITGAEAKTRSMLDRYFPGYD